MYFLELNIAQNHRNHCQRIIPIAAISGHRLLAINDVVREFALITRTFAACCFQQQTHFFTRPFIFSSIFFIDTFMMQYIVVSCHTAHSVAIFQLHITEGGTKEYKIR
jgi:hypothetical protein